MPLGAREEQSSDTKGLGAFDSWRGAKREKQQQCAVAGLNSLWASIWAEEEGRGSREPFKRHP